MEGKPKGYSLFVWIGAALACGLVYISGSKYGPAFTYDSVNYIYAGHSLAEKGKLLRPMGESFIEWPPLYPILIAALNILPGALLHYILYIQAIIMGCTVWIAGRLALRWIKQPLIFITTYTALVFSTPLLVVNHFVWSESFFCFLTVVQLSLLTRYTVNPTPSTWRWMILNGILLCLQRHVGVFLIVGTATALLFYPAASFRQRIRRSFLYSFIPILPLLGWWLRNYILKGQAMNDYSETLFNISFMEHFLAFHSVFTAWFLPNEFPVLVRIVFVYGCSIYLVVKYISNTQADKRDFNTTISLYSKINAFTYKDIRLINILGMIFLSYFVLTYAASFTVNEYIDDRILSPAYVPGILLFFFLLDRYISTIEQILVKKIILCVCLIWILYPIARTFHNVYTWHNQPVGIPASQPVEEEMKFIYTF